MPTIIKGLGNWDRAQVQALTIPCYALGAISYLGVAKFSDRIQRRAVFTVTFGLICTTGYAILISPAPGGVKYFGCFLVATGLYVVVGLPLAWLPSNNPRYGKRTVATGLQLTIGNSAGIPAPFVRHSVLDRLELLTADFFLSTVVQDIRGPSVHQRPCCFHGIDRHVLGYLPCILGLVPSPKPEEALWKGGLQGCKHDRGRGRGARRRKPEVPLYLLRFMVD